MSSNADSSSDINAEQRAEKHAEWALFENREDHWCPAPETASKVTSITGKNTVVAVRIRPVLEGEAETGGPQAVYARTDTTGIAQTWQNSIFETDRVYHDATTTEFIFDDVVRPLVTEVCNGRNATLFAYGQTGSGKTHTVSQLQNLAAKAIFEENSKFCLSVHMSIIELAGNKAYDLLYEGDLDKGKPVTIIDDGVGGTNLRGADEVAMPNAGTMIKRIETAAARRRTSATDKNSASSRSHAICRIRVRRAGDIEVGELYLVDLAGSEAARDTAAHGKQRVDETRQINSSLSVLSSCIQKKAGFDAGKKHVRVPFRESALTRVLRHIFDPKAIKQCKMVVLACVAPCLEDVKSTKNTFRYAMDCRGMDAKKKVVLYNPTSPTTWKNKQLKDWIKENSGTPAIDADILAPSESGAQIIALAASEFEQRCLKTVGVTSSQASAFQSKLWRMHTDAKGARCKKTPSAANAAPAGRTTSKEPNVKVQSLPFANRIRPGMVVEYKPRITGRETKKPNMGKSDTGEPDVELVMVFSDMSAVDYATHVSLGAPEHPRSRSWSQARITYMCARLIRNHPTAKSGYELQPWDTIAVDAKEMKREVIMAYDQPSRLYFLEI
ncbi:hypothetical protein AK830_g12010 [Neonectria ditissima]|uniref:Kinesin-like protein n=1 Tax=Neonectria ditissima TaxID=78410 RepID=A0A0P7B448_9HYPO|nr:hypothetical protein AK830_g12010 [Neonectria ditissima]